MSNKRITDLTELTTPTTDDVFPVVDIATNTTTKVQLGNLPVPTAVTTALATKQDTLVSGTNIKTVNSTSLVGSGDVAVQETLVSGTNIKTLNSTSLLGSGDIVLTANPSGVAGAIQFSDGSAFASDATNFFWDDTNNRLGIGTNAPTTDLQVFGLNPTISTKISSNQIGKFAFLSSANTELAAIQLNGSSGEMRMFTSLSYFPTFYSSGLEAMRISTARNLGIGLTNPTARTHIQGSGSTSATTSLLVQNSAGTAALTVKDDLSALFGDKIGYGNLGTERAYFQALPSGENRWFTQAGGYFTTIYSNGAEAVRIAATGNLLLGTTTDVASSLMTLASTTKGFLPPRMTTTQKNAISSPAAGLVVYDSTTNKLCCYDGSTWNDLF
jgi:hypothetical protein